MIKYTLLVGLLLTFNGYLFSSYHELSESRPLYLTLNDTNISSSSNISLQSLPEPIQRFIRTAKGRGIDFKQYYDQIKEKLPEIIERMGIDAITPIDLTGAKLNEIDFSNRTLKNIIFDNAQLIKNDFSGATIEQCTFKKAILFDTNFNYAIIRNTNFSDADCLKEYYQSSQYFLSSTFNNTQFIHNIINPDLKTEIQTNYPTASFV
jgi:uncharacterized protein YjbI with pentapeptide repeats